MGEIKICVLGAGVIGLSTAVNILENVCEQDDIKVDIIAEEFSPNTTSDIASGIWMPLDVKDIAQAKIRKRLETTFNHMQRLSVSANSAQIGAFVVSGYSISKEQFDPPPYKDILHGFREMTKPELANFQGFSFGYSYTSFLLEGSKYLPWLMNRFIKKGGKALKKKVHSIGELAARYDIVVNCTGLGSCELVLDEELKPARGQMIKVHAPWIKHFVEVDNGFAYIFPRSDHVLLGGTYDLDNYDKAVDMNTRQRILAECVKLIPSLQYARHLEDLVGLRPRRNFVRLEAEEIVTGHKKLQVVHNYGHGGSGIALHWGCAQDAARLVKESVNRIRTTQAKL